MSIEKNIRSRIEKTDIDGFTFNEAPVKSEMAVVNSVRDEYRSSFELGAYGSNTDTVFSQFQQKLKQAGLDKVQAEFIKQYNAFLAQKKK